MSKLYITSDWHLAEGAWKSRPEIAGDAFESLTRLVKKVDICDATGLALDFILAAGDLFDTKLPSSEVINTAKDILPAKLFMLYIQGQHEYSKVPWMRVLDGLHAGCEGYATKLPNHWVWGLDWTLSLNLQDKLDAIGAQLADHLPQFPDDYNILVLHQTCNAVMAGTGKDREARLEYLNFRACELNDGMIPAGFDLVIVGDTHYHTEFQLRDKSGKMIRCLSPGSFAMQSISETNVGKCFVLDLETREITSEDLYRRTYEEIQIDGPVEFDQEIRRRIKDSAVENQLDRPIIRYTLYENDADRVAALKQACLNKVHPFFNVVSTETEENQIELGQTEDVDELIINAIQEAEATDEAKTLLTALINSNSSDEILNTYYKDMVLRC